MMFIRTALAAIVALRSPHSPARAPAQNGPGDAQHLHHHAAQRLARRRRRGSRGAGRANLRLVRLRFAAETPGKTGLAHALEHMMFRGTTDISSGGLDDIVARLGAQMNGQTNYDYTEFYFEMPADKLDVALAIDADRMQHAAAARLGLGDRAQRRAQRDRRRCQFAVLQFARARASRRISRSAAGRTPLGNRNDVARATVADIARYYREWYAPNNATLVIAGDVATRDRLCRSAALLRRDSGKASADLDRGESASRRRKPRRSGVSVSVRGARLRLRDSGRHGARRTRDQYALHAHRDSVRRFIKRWSRATSRSRSRQTPTRTQGRPAARLLDPQPRAQRDRAQAAFTATIDSVLKNGFDPDLVLAAKRLTIAERLYEADSIDGIGDLAGYTYGVVRERSADEDKRLAALPVTICLQ